MRARKQMVILSSLCTVHPWNVLSLPRPQSQLTRASALPDLGWGDFPSTQWVSRICRMEELKVLAALLQGLSASFPEPSNLVLTPWPSIGVWVDMWLIAMVSWAIRTLGLGLLPSLCPVGVSWVQWARPACVGHNCGSVETSLLCFGAMLTCCTLWSCLSCPTGSINK